MKELLGEVLNYIVGVIKVGQASGHIHPSELPAPYAIEGKVRRALAAKEFDDDKYKTLLAASKKALEFMEQVEFDDWNDGGNETMPVVEEFRQLIKGA